MFGFSANIGSLDRTEKPVFIHAMADLAAYAWQSFGPSFSRRTRSTGFAPFPAYGSTWKLK